MKNIRLTSWRKQGNNYVLNVAWEEPSWMFWCRPKTHTIQLVGRSTDWFVPETGLKVFDRLDFLAWQFKNAIRKGILDHLEEKNNEI